MAPFYVILLTWSVEHGTPVAPPEGLLHPKDTIELCIAARDRVEKVITEGDLPYAVTCVPAEHLKEGFDQIHRQLILQNSEKV